MATFDFITHEDFRASLESDYRELNACLRAEAPKAVHVLAGSIIEALLIDSLLVHPDPGPTQKDILKMDLAEIIEVCKAKGIISGKTADLSSVVRSYRNLIHPGRLVRLGESVDANGAKVAQALVEMIVKEVAAGRRGTYGFTAEQIVSKLERDPGSVPILEHLLREVKPVEMERLLLKVLPARYLELSEEQTEVPAESFIALENGFRAAFRLSEDNLKAGVVRRFVSFLKEESGHTITTYQDAFFRASDIAYLSAAEAGLVKSHLLARAKATFDADSLKIYKGLGKFLDSTEVRGLVDVVVRLTHTLKRQSKGQGGERLLRSGVPTYEWRGQDRGFQAT